jgi:hypothetical protein
MFLTGLFSFGVVVGLQKSSRDNGDSASCPDLVSANIMILHCHGEFVKTKKSTLVYYVNVPVFSINILILSQEPMQATTLHLPIIAP